MTVKTLEEKVVGLITSLDTVLGELVRDRQLPPEIIIDLINLKRRKMKKKKERRMKKKKVMIRLKSSSSNLKEINQLPTEIIIDILSRLPATCVVECKRVCKTWRTLIGDTIFSNIHLGRQLLQFDHGPSPKVGTGLLFEIMSKYPLGSLLYYGDYDEIINIDKKHVYKTLTRINHPSIEGRWKVVGSCNGLMCLSVNVDESLIYDPTCIFNPINNEYIHLPRLSSIITTNCYLIVSGFGYIPSTNEYKIVRIFYSRTYYESYDDDQLPEVGNIQIYTLGSGNGWKDIGESTDLTDWPLGLPLDGALYWMGYEKNILAFDLAEEKFRFLQSPPCSETSNIRLLVLGDCLSAVIDADEHLDIWQFREQKNHCSNWVMAFRIEGEGRMWDEKAYYNRPFALRNNGEVLLWDKRNILSCYDPKTATMKELVDDFKVLRGFSTIHHMNSLVSLKALGETCGKREKDKEKSA